LKAALALTHDPAEIAALATAAANAADHPADARRYGKQAIKAAPKLAPAIAAYARALRRSNKERAARKVLVNGWAASPHPLIAAAFLEKISSPIERAQAASELAKAAPGQAESEFLLAETSLAAQLSGEAKRHAHAAIQAGMTDKRPYNVLATVEPSPDNISAAASAPAARWLCENCSAETSDWAAICPSCGKAGRLAWKTSAKSTALAVVAVPAPQRAGV
jgi:HemY protein